jgi:hypothetical protein
MQNYSCLPVGNFALAAALLCFGAGLGALEAAEPNRRAQPGANDVGIWKSYAPHGIHGEFHNYDPVGLMAGSLIHADCSINWRDPDTGKLYCFASGTSFNYFQDWPKTYGRKAKEAFERMQKERPGS